MKIEMFRAGHGDCFLIQLNKNNNTTFNILIDGGTAASFDIFIKNKIIGFLKNNVLDLVIITHADDDHLLGVYKLFQKLQNDGYDIPTLIKKVIFNHPKTSNSVSNDNSLNRNTSARVQENMLQLLEKYSLLDNILYTNDGTKDIEDDGINITFLSPDISMLDEYISNYESTPGTSDTDKCVTKGKIEKNDYQNSISELMDDNSCEELNLNNKVSIALYLYETTTKESILMLGDSDYYIISKKLEALGYRDDKKLTVDFIKLSHHGSIGNLTEDFLKLINCNNFLVSTNGMKYHHPNKKTLSRIWKHNQDAKIYFNYEDRIDALFHNKDLIYKNKCSKFKGGFEWT